ncbi:hypothetical protein BU23DRAFT_278865 [Bimuria novae-zelandiae CBS 107.79]|uniref:Uncharacterized protein n=1 Tax=Bimuria novae-zelandiae CBS 107.79 TaxID=1447943 RepID=A0A6A5UYW9_9PLEO|nr:hypothetical protein BU23DRAFT_278865 [Bimuria novae-zelandiae CBS 107.79]
MSTSPASKRSLKPSTIVAGTQQQNAQLASSTELPALQPATTAQQDSFASAAQPSSPASARKRKSVSQNNPSDQMANPSTAAGAAEGAAVAPAVDADAPVSEPKAKKSRTNTPWTPAEEQRLKQMRDAGHSWSEIAKTFPQRTEGSVKKHWYKDMHYAEFGEDEKQSAALLAAIKEYDANKWKVVGQKVGKPAKACEQYAKEHFGGRA